MSRRNKSLLLGPTLGVFIMFLSFLVGGLIVAPTKASEDFNNEPVIEGSTGVVSGTGNYTVDENGRYVINEDAICTVENLTIDGKTSTNGGAIYVSNGATLTLNNFSTAYLTSIFVAFISTSKVYFPSAIAILLFSVITGLIMISCGAFIMRTPPLFSRLLL